MVAGAATAASAASSILDFAGNSIMANSANAKSKRAALMNFAMQNYFMNKQNEYNKPINQMKRLREAGLNPNLVYDNGNAVIASASPSGGVTPEVTPSSGTFNILGKMQAVKSMQQQEANIKNTEAQTNAIDENIDLKKAELAERVRYNNERLKLLDKQVERYGVQNVKSQAEIDYLNNKFDWRNPNDLKKLPEIAAGIVQAFEDYNNKH